MVVRRDHPHWHGSTKTVDVHIAALSQGLNDAADRLPPGGRPVIATIRGHGYRLEVPARATFPVEQ